MAQDLHHDNDRFHEEPIKGQHYRQEPLNRFLIIAIDLKQWKPYFSIKRLSERGNPRVVVLLGEPVGLTFRCRALIANELFKTDPTFERACFDQTKASLNIPGQNRQHQRIYNEIQIQKG
jgi:hypothetical protein